MTAAAPAPPITAATIASAPPAATARRVGWVHGPVLDITMALCWVPFAVAGFVLTRGAGNEGALRWFVTATLLLSFSHQPVTAAMVYGDKAQFALRRRIFTWSPLVFVVAVLVVRDVNFALLAVVAGLWNSEHTLMQRYGIGRIYARKAGLGDLNRSGEKLMLFSWLATALVWASADARTPGLIDRTGIGGHNREGLNVLTDLQPAARIVLPIIVLAALVLTLRWLRNEWRLRDRTNPAKWLYFASTAALFVTIFVNPIAGFLGYVGAHAVEYFIIVHQSIGTRYASAEVDGGAPFGRAVRNPAGRPGFFVVYFALVAALVVVLGRYATPAVQAAVIFTLGGMHVFYDGFIWKLRRPVVARSLDIASA